MIDGLAVEIGDIVWDIVQGTGKVISNDGPLGFSVRFDDNKVIVFNRDGTKSGRRRLYWQEPIIITAKGPDDKLFKQLKIFLPYIENAFSALSDSPNGTPLMREISSKPRISTGSRISGGGCKDCGGNI